MAKTNNDPTTRKRSRATRLLQSKQLVLRKCQVCEWEAEVVEGPGENPDCPWCHGPTLRVAVVEASVPAIAGDDKNPHAAALGRLGGLKGGQARAARLSPKKRREIALKAARARWAKHKG
jgi:hypothetical protein